MLHLTGYQMLLVAAATLTGLVLVATMIPA
jgi:hypothetical protein